MTPAAIELLLLAIKLTKVIFEQIDLAGLDELPPEIREELLAHRESLLDEMARLDALA